MSRKRIAVPGIAAVAALMEFGLILAGGSGVANAAGPCGANGTFSSVGSTGTCAYGAANGADTFMVPSGVNSLNVVVDGGAGGDSPAVAALPVGPGGPGGEYKATVTGAGLPGTTLSVFPGQAGGLGSVNDSSSAGGGGGGAASTLGGGGQLLIVAGGGGGGGGGGSNGGDGGGSAHPDGTAGGVTAEFGGPGLASGQGGAGGCDIIGCVGAGAGGAPGSPGGNASTASSGEGQGGGGAGSGGLTGGNGAAATGLAHHNGAGGGGSSNATTGGSGGTGAGTGTASGAAGNGSGGDGGGSGNSDFGGGGGGGGFAAGGGGTAAGGGGGSASPASATTITGITVTPDTTDTNTNTGAGSIVISFTVGPPSATITTPSNRAVYAKDEVVNAAYACQDDPNGPGIQSCTGPVPNGSPIDTSTPGQHSFQVTATSKDGQSSSTTSTYTVNPGPTPPTATIFVPPSGARVGLRQAVRASYSCSPGANGATLRSCVGTVANGSPIDTATSGGHTFTVTATDTDGQAVTVSSTYTVGAGPVAQFAITNTKHPGTGQPVKFDGSASSETGGSIANWSWNFGDGKTASGEKVKHTYKKKGTYTVTLTVTDAHDVSASTSQKVKVTKGDRITNVTVSGRTVSVTLNGPGKLKIDSKTYKVKQAETVTRTIPQPPGKSMVKVKITFSPNEGNHQKRTATVTFAPVCEKDSGPCEDLFARFLDAAPASR